MIYDEVPSWIFATEVRKVVIEMGCYFDCQRLRAAGPGTRSVVFRHSADDAEATCSASEDDSKAFATSESCTRGVQNHRSFAKSSKYYTPTLTLPLGGGGKSKVGRIFNAHPLDVFGGARLVINWNRRPGVAMNFQVGYVEFRHASTRMCVSRHSNEVAKVT